MTRLCFMAALIATAWFGISNLVPLTQLAVRQRVQQRLGSPLYIPPPAQITWTPLLVAVALLVLAVISL